MNYALSTRKSVRLTLPALCALTFPAVAVAQDLTGLPQPLVEAIETAKQACGDFENGTFTLDWGAVHRVDFDGDLDRDWVLDEGHLACSSAVSLYCGTGGCMSHFVIDGHSQAILNQGWEVVTLGPNRVVLTDVHGSECGGINLTPCVTASTWDPEQNAWRSAAAVWE